MRGVFAMFCRIQLRSRSAQVFTLALAIPLVGFSAFWAIYWSCFNLAQSKLPSINFELTSNSMAPTLMGPSFQAACDRCNFCWQVAAETFDHTLPLACPKCRNIVAQVGRSLPGEIATVSLLDHKKFAQSLNRLDCIVYAEHLATDPKAADLTLSSELDSIRPGVDWICKRIWGMPNEEIAIRQGELWINGVQFQKNLEQLQQVALPVSDFPFELMTPWHLSRVDSTETRTMRRDTVHIEAGWQLSWDYGRSLHQADQQEQFHYVLDDYDCNHSTTRSLLPVDDLLLTIEFDVSASLTSASQSLGSAIITCFYNGQLHSIDCRFGKPAHQEKRLMPEIVNPKRLSIGGWDGLVWVQWDSEPAILLSTAHISSKVEKPDRVQTASSALSSESKVPTSFRIRTLEGRVGVKRLRVDRDIYLRVNERDPRNGEPESTVLGIDAYYVIGDNLPISRDSRNGTGTIRRSQMLGKLIERP